MKAHKRLLALTGCFTLVSAIGFAQMDRRSYARLQTSSPHRAVVTGSRWGWASQEWTGDERPYRQARAELERRAASGQLTDAALRNYRASAQAQPTDPLASFRWGFAAYQAAKLAPRYHDRSRILAGVELALQRAPSPRTYQFARLRFLIEGRDFPYPQLRPLGERLVRRDPDDVDVKHHFLKYLNVSRSPAEKERALAYARDLIRLAPQDPRSHFALGQVWMRIWNQSKSRSDADKAVAAYRKSLELEPPGRESRETIEQLIRLIQKEQTQRRKPA